jgi:primosomal protein N' (replication factor Y)
MTLCDKEPAEFDKKFAEEQKFSENEQVVAVAVPRPLPLFFTYKIPSRMLPLVEVGSWVKVPFGASTTHGYIVEPPKPLAQAPVGLDPRLLKEILEIGEEGCLFPEDIFALCRWAQEYYCAPLGEVLNCAVPKAILSSRPKSESSKTPESPESGPPRRVKTPSCLVQHLLPQRPLSRHPLTEDQKKVADFLDDLRQQGGGKVALLQGVTGSGKTEVYIELVKRTLEAGKGALILVPEIALTPQLHSRFEMGLGIPVGIWHSAVAQGKKRAQNKSLLKGEMRVIVGARSSVFAPVQKLGLIVVDEEHDSTYKQEDRVRYNARDLAIVRAKITQSFVVLGSATPCLETLERVREKRYSCSFLNQRIAAGGMPQIELVDLCVEPKVEKTQAPLAVKTIQAIQETLDLGEQVIVYLNRRGFASFILCKECGDVSGCPQCSISLTFHKYDLELKCHLCGFRMPIPECCQKCKGLKLIPMGAGTESLAEELPRLLTGAQVVRLDRDQITSATRLEKILESFRSGQNNILLGTQMLVKGHDFPGVTLVVVVLADGLFRWPDFRAPERALQILRQVSGRAGRGDKKGRVIIQTFDVDHPVLSVMDGRLSESDFLASERDLRQILNYPPFGRLARLRIENSEKMKAKDRSQLLSTQIQKLFSKELLQNGMLQVLGPSEAFLERIKGIYRWDILIKSKNVQVLHPVVSFARDFCFKNKWNLMVDVDPSGI